MDIFRKLQEQLHNKYKIFYMRFSSRKQDFSFAMKNNKMTSCCTLNLRIETEQKKKAIDEQLTKLVKKYINNPEKLIKYMQFKGLNVYSLKNAEKLLARIKEEEGFITPQKGIEALYINLLSGLAVKKLKIGFSTQPLFIFNENSTEIYTIARALYKYYGYNYKMPGYDYKSQKLFKKIYNSKNKTASPFGGCTIEQMYACKDAIQRDLESVNFSIKLSEETAGAKNALKKIKETSSAKV